jgi:hypothetical protein
MPTQRLYISTEEYFDLPYASNSGVKEAEKILGTGNFEEYVQTHSYYHGSALDALLTEPECIATKDMSEVQRQTLLPMARSIQADDTYKRLFHPDVGGEVQAVIVNLELPINVDGMPVTIPGKCKFDWFNPGRVVNFGGDLKTTEASTQEQFESAAKWFHYPQQAAWYMDVSETDRFAFIGVSKKNFRIFKIFIKRGDPLYLSGREKYLRDSASWFKLNGNRVA